MKYKEQVQDLLDKTTTLTESTMKTMETPQLQDKSQILKYLQEIARLLQKTEELINLEYND